MELETIGGSREPVIWGTHPLKKGEMLHGWFGGGGGYGDPLQRDSELVKLDVSDEKVSHKWAEKLYGVVLNQDLEVDVDQTTRLRRETAEKRLHGRTEKPAAGERVTTKPARKSELVNLSENLKAVKTQGGVNIQCTKCDHTISKFPEPWKDHCVLIQSPLTYAGPWRSESGLFEMREYICGGCAQLLDVEVALPEDPPLYDEVHVHA